MNFPQRRLALAITLIVGASLPLAGFAKHSDKDSNKHSGKSNKPTIELCVTNRHTEIVSLRPIRLNKAGKYLRRGATLPITLYLDADGDGFGAAEAPLEGCDEAVSGFVDNDVDLDDTVPHILALESPPPPPPAPDPYNTPPPPPEEDCYLPWGLPEIYGCPTPPPPPPPSPEVDPVCLYYPTLPQCY